MRRVLWVLAAASGVACSSTPSGPSGGETARSAGKPGATSDAAAPTIARKLPPGVLDEVRGKQGVIRVEERNGLRQLTINGVVQGAMRVGAAQTAGGDPLVTLIKTVRPTAKRVLVIGLGTGKTATDFTRAGMQVEVVELEPRVIELARKYFGYTGHAVAANGAKYLETNTVKHDVVVIDAVTRQQPPPALVSSRALNMMISGAAPGAVIAVRAVGSPADTWVKILMRSMRDSAKMRYPQLFGSGLGSERQNLYALTSSRPLHLVNVKGLPMWPLQVTAAPVSAGWSGTPGPGKAERTIELIGYIIKLDDGSLALDLPHWEMGAQRYLLTGAPAAPLAALLPKATQFPTAGDLHTDGNLRTTLHGVFGGGGTKRSEVRFSPVVAAVRGKATLRSVIHPNAAIGVPKPLRKNAPNDPRLPYGGALYQLELTAVHWSFTTAQWRELQRKARPHLDKAIRHIGRGDLGMALKETSGYLHAFETQFRSHVRAIHAYQLLEGVFKKLKEQAQQLAPTRAAFDLATACDRAGQDGVGYGRSAVAAARLGRALRECARSNYARAMDRDKQHRDTAIRRLLALYDVDEWDVGKFKVKVYARKLKQLQKRFPSLSPLQTPPR